mmetsp:Transcript_991/g.2430  ORF Transcript_991/g.2430 Transcript_991/m.2430 type:complete len:361 (-) Transcript_991:1070-2152(-)
MDGKEGCWGKKCGAGVVLSCGCALLCHLFDFFCFLVFHIFLLRSDDNLSIHVLEAPMNSVVGGDKDMVASHFLCQSGSQETLHDGDGGVAKAELNATLLVCSVHVGDDMKCRSVNLRDRGKFPNDEFDIGVTAGLLQFLFRHTFVLLELFANILGVGKENRCVDPHHDNALVALGIGILLDVTVNGRTRETSQDASVGIGRLVNDQKERDTHSNEQTSLDSQEHGAEASNHPYNKVELVDLPEVHGFGVIQQPNDTGNNDSSKDSKRQLFKDGGQEKQDDGHEGGSHHTAHSAHGTRLVVDSRTAKGTSHGVGTKHGPEEVGHSQSNQFKRGVQIVLVLGSQLLGNSNGFHKADNGNRNH